MLTQKVVAVQVEIAVADHCASIPMATGALAMPQKQPSRIVRVMAPDVALAHKLAAWNERRLLRDLYDVHFLSARVGATPDTTVLRTRLDSFRSRLPALKRRRKMKPQEFVAELSLAVEELTQSALVQELGGILEAEEIAGLHLRIRAAASRILERLDWG